ncbi:GspE/PulE family protein [Tuwongella immobilis]|uniref:AAA+ ATPase domain-containing protein n=1 Tax=Tuwongella immobilis TaxID=692036 RepID=A0A6C2YKB9_9BACT|nr:GspE/PulE family protein [Tuwongella immobilis]VIP01553.1 type ii secretion system protein e : Type II secretory pathway, ATPase PulE/Tfp pilus assembly pathway, ATPase PilB OS=Singulisphaera acidiphila (strain ATCC BAA-1392 / DSM 18658 / VKM B-2454 / MOB10) GN=Sinac_6460 PE=4 SV=1: T2SE_Nter: T2SE [Tuwongella immobilis]VTR98750.1 type ii secretion system protein e : Type II secretory pathway, ATPase PulE/Tfp pilus assembly pathway, ATPase PilB OS=Singulisphaera acidiphila (strain ATCC BAA-139
MAKGRGDFTDLLIRNKVLGAEQLEEARAYANSTGLKLQEAIVKSGYASVKEVMSAVAEFNNLQFVDMNEVEIPKSVIELVPESVARENVVIPLALEGNVLKIITSDPSNYEAMQKLQFILNKDVQPVLADHEQIREAINRQYGQNETESVDSMLSEFTDTAIDNTNLESAVAHSAVDESDAPVVKLCNLIIQEAVSARASDIHIEPFDDRVRVRYRIDGVLTERDACPRRLLLPMLSRFKIMSNIDISEKRRPQDGRIKMSISGRHYDLRVSMLPTVHGQSAVMRILDRSNIQVGIKDLGFYEEDYQKFQQVIKRPNGIFLVTGPTGSGKTTTLYAAMNELNRPDRKIITAEDPVEYYLPGINQVEVKHQIGLNFARIIRAMLRQAPNIILVGEIRDKETAEIAVQASLTGHLVFSTLHTNDAPSAVTRLADIGVAPFLIASSVIAIMGQRLVRVNCSKCKQPYTPPAHELRAAGITPEMAAKANFMRGVGCSHCRGNGFRGRLAIFEMLKMNSRIREMTFAQEPAQTLRKEARKTGMRTLLEDGISKALKGLTTVDEVLDTCHAETEVGA